MSAAAADVTDLQQDLITLNLPRVVDSTGQEEILTR